MKIKFRYGGLDRRAWWLSVVTILLLGGVCAYLWCIASGAYYIAAWATTTAVVLVALFLLSVPRRIILSEDELELRCLVETTYIPLHTIVDVEVLGSEGFGGKVPLLGIYGFGGYYGRYLDLRRWSVYRVYASRRSGCVAIHTTKKRYLVSCRTPEMLRVMIQRNKVRSSRER